LVHFIQWVYSADSLFAAGLGLQADDAGEAIIIFKPNNLAFIFNLF
jgi:hypothetical protein